MPRSNDNRFRRNSPKGDGKALPTRDEMADLWAFVRKVNSPDSFVQINHLGNTMGLQVGAGAYARFGTSLIKITSSVDYETYLADVYGSGKHVAATSTGVTVKALDIASGEQVPSGTWWKATNHPWDDGAGGSVYRLTFEVPRFLGYTTTTTTTT